MHSQLEATGTGGLELLDVILANKIESHKQQLKTDRASIRYLKRVLKKYKLGDLLGIAESVDYWGSTILFHVPLKHRGRLHEIANRDNLNWSITWTANVQDPRSYKTVFMRTASWRMDKGEDSILIALDAEEMRGNKLPDGCECHVEPQADVRYSSVSCKIR